MRAEVEGPDAEASGTSKARAIASLVACLTALNAPVEPAVEVQPIIEPEPRARWRPGFGLQLKGFGLAGPALAVLLIFIATASLADRRAVWPTQVSAGSASQTEIDPDGLTDWCGRPCAGR